MIERILIEIRDYYFFLLIVSVLILLVTIYFYIFIYTLLLFFDIFFSFKIWEKKQTLIWGNICFILINSFTLLIGEIDLKVLVMIAAISFYIIFTIKLFFKAYNKGYGIFIIGIINGLALYALERYIFEIYDDLQKYSINNIEYQSLILIILKFLSILLIPQFTVFFLPPLQKPNKPIEKFKVLRWQLLFFMIFILLNMLLLVFIFSALTTVKFDFTVLSLLYVYLILIFGAIKFLISYFKKYRKIKIDSNTLIFTNIVAYLRSFNQQNISFWVGKKNRFYQEFDGKKNNFFSYFNIFPDLFDFDDFFNFQAQTKIGKLVGLGNPNDRIPNDKTATIYTNDEEWKSVFFSLIEKSKCIFLQIGDTKHIEFELNEIKNQGFSQKVFILTRPKIIHLHHHFLHKFILFLTDRKEANFNSFQNILKNVGFTCPISFEYGSIYCFNKFNQLSLIASNCELPSQYIDHIKTYLDEN